MKFSELAFPLHITAGESLTQNKGRWIVRDAMTQKIGTLYDMEYNVAMGIINAANQIGSMQGVGLHDLEQFDVFVTIISGDGKAPKTTTDHADLKPPHYVMESIKFPAWMGRHPRYGAQWCDEEKQHLRQAWEAGHDIPDIMAAHGRDRSSIIGNLERMFGDSWLMYKGITERQRIEALERARTRKLAKVRECLDRLADAMKALNS